METIFAHCAGCSITASALRSIPLDLSQRDEASAFDVATVYLVLCEKLDFNVAKIIQVVFGQLHGDET
jgi:hypothetical protein